MQKTIVLINGEKQVGKSTYANHLQHLLDEQEIHTAVHSFVRPLEGALRGMLESSYGKDYVDQFSYEEIKSMTWLGVDGRAWMIEFGNAARRIANDTLPKAFFARADAASAVDVWVIENWGFPDEIAAIKAMADLRDWRVYSVALTYRASRKYKCGEQFDEDNRFNLDCVADFVNMRVNDLARIIDDDKSPDLYPFDTVAQQFGQPAELIPLYEAVTKLDYGEDGQWESDTMPSVEYLKMVTGDPTLTVSAVQAAMVGRRRSDFAPANIEITTQVGTLDEPETAIIEKDSAAN